MFRGGGPENCLLGWSMFKAARAACAAGVILSTGDTGLALLLILVVGLCKRPLLEGEIGREGFELKTWFALGVVVV